VELLQTDVTNILRSLPHFVYE